MRPTKFRLIKDGRVVGYMRTATGPLGEDSSKMGWSYSGNNTGWNGYYILHDAIEQFTGKLDKSNTEIYENDKIEAMDRNNKKHVGKVCWGASNMSWRVDWGKNCRLMRSLGVLYSEDIEIIGRSGE